MNLVSTSRNPIPEGAIVGAVETPDRIVLRFSRWLHAGDGRGTIVLLQGRSEFIEKYFEVVAELRRRDFDVVTFDWRGQGLSDRLLPDRRKGYVESFGRYNTDLRTIFTEIVFPTCRPPHIGLAHSSGGAVLLRTAVEGEFPLESVVLTSPMIGLPCIGASELARIALRAAVAAGLSTTYVPGGRDAIMDLRPFAGNRRTSDPERFARGAEVIAVDPSLGLGSPTIGWMAAAVEAAHQFADPAYSTRLRGRSLIVAAGGDRIVSTTATRAFATRSSSIFYEEVPQARHELLMERDVFRARFWAAFDAFLGSSGGM